MQYSSSLTLYFVVLDDVRLCVIICDAFECVVIWCNIRLVLLYILWCLMMSDCCMLRNLFDYFNNLCFFLLSCVSFCVW